MRVQRQIPLGLRSSHDPDQTYHLQQSQITGAHVVKVDFDIPPAGAIVNQVQALRLVVDDADWEELIVGGVDAMVVLPCKEVDPHDAEDKPEDEANQEHVHDGRDGTKQSIHHNLKMLKHKAQFSLRVK